MRARAWALRIAGALAAALGLAGVVPATGGVEGPPLLSFRSYAAADSGFAPAAAARLAERSPSYWGGRYTTSTGESVRVIAWDGYPVDESVTRAWAEFLAGLVHGRELARVTLYLAPPDEITATCRTSSAACYSPAFEIIVAPLEDVPGGPTAQALVAHEYGHHVARNRLNPPWDALLFGTKRWASRMGVCAKAAAGTLFPGDAGSMYRLDPAEGFAESYRLVNEIRQERPESPWQLVDRSLYPSDAALRALERDVLEPWTQPISVAYSGSFRPGGRTTRSFALSTPYDGDLKVSLSAQGKARHRLSLYDARRKATVATARPGARTLSTTICGHRSLAVQVTRQAGFGRFRLTVSKP